jgi:hypothetical protein
MSCLSGLFAVWIMNVLWCYYLLRIIPQVGDISLTQAQADGKIKIKQSKTKQSKNKAKKKKKKK